MIIKKIDGKKEIQTNVVDNRVGEIGISQHNMAKMADHVTKNLYSNIHGSIIREYVSNAYDAHIDRMKSEFIADGGHPSDYKFSRDEIRKFSDEMPPIHLKIDKDGQGHYLSIRDFGLGMSEWHIDTYFRQFGESSKDDANDELGAFGVGSKSFQTYTDACYYSTIHRENGKNIKRDFMMLATEGLPMFKPLYDNGEVTDEKCGTTVKMYIKWEDVSLFKQEAREQLLYFKRVFFDIDGFDNDYKIFETDLFMYSDTEALSQVHAVLGVVAYPIDFKTIGLPEALSNCPIGVKFDIGDFGVTLSREKIRYAPETKKLIKDKVEKALLSAVDMYNNTLTDGYKTLVDYARNFSNREYLVMMDDKTTMKIGASIIRWAQQTHQVAIQPVVVHEYPQYDFSLFKEKGGFDKLMVGIVADRFINKQTVRLKKNPRRSWYNDNGHWKIVHGSNGFVDLFGDTNRRTVYWGRTNDNPTIHQVRYCHDIADSNNTVWLVKGFDRRVELPDDAGDWSVINFAKGLGIKVGRNNRNEQWFIETRKVYADMRKAMVDAFPVMNDITVSAAKKKELRVKYTDARTGGGRTKGSITVYEYQDKRSVRPTNSISIEIDQLEEHYKGYIVVYVNKKNAPHDKISPFFRINYWGGKSFVDKYKIKFIAVAPSYIDTVKSMTNSFTLDEFYEHDVFLSELAIMKMRDLVAETIDGKDGQLEYLYDKVDKLFGTDLGKQRKNLITYKKDAVLSLHPYVDDQYEHEAFFKKYPNRKDVNYMEKCLELSKKCRTFDFVKFFNTSQEGVIEVIKEWATCKGLKLKELND